MNSSPTSSLIRALGLRDSLAIVVGSMIGTGIFLKTAVMTQALGSPFWVLMAWLAAGTLSLLGAMTYAELGALFPQAGGGYVYIREAYGRLPAFLAGWVSFSIVLPGSIAAYAVAAATFLSGALPTQEHNVLIAIGLIVLFALLNSLAVSFGGLVQSILTGLKIVMIFALAVSIFWFSNPTSGIDFSIWSSSTLTLGAFSVATLSALWAYDGWEAIGRVAGEVKNPQKTLPQALIFGILIVFGLYAFLNLAFFWALPLDEIVTSNSTSYPNALPVATKAVWSFLGERGVQVISMAFVISTLGAMNGCVMTAARVPFAIAKDKLFFSYLSRLSPNTKVPVRALWIQALVASLFAASGSFDQLTNYVVFSAWIFYGLTGFALFVFRKTHSDQKRRFKVPGYPVIPAVFVLMSVGLVLTTVWQSPKESLVGLILIFAGIPIYFFFYRQQKGEI